MSEKCLQCKRQCAILIIQKITNGVTTKYVYGLGLIGEENAETLRPITLTTAAALRR